MLSHFYTITAHVPSGIIELTINVQYVSTNLKIHGVIDCGNTIFIRKPTVISYEECIKRLHRFLAFTLPMPIIYGQNANVV